MNRLNVLTALAFLVIVLALLALQAWTRSPRLWAQLDLGLVVFTATAAWLGCSIGLPSGEPAEDAAGRSNT